MSKPTTNRTTISIPQALKRRMEKTTGENWSAIACHAFEDKLAEIASKKEQKSLDDVILRLRASKQKAGTVAFNEGREVGSDWCRNRAEVPELERLESAIESLGTDFESWAVGSAFGVGEQMVFAMRPDAHGQRGEAREFWELALGDPRNKRWHDADFIRGFVDAALEIWREVEPHL